jgi:hypothetical protein
LNLPGKIKRGALGCGESLLQLRQAVAMALFESCQSLSVTIFDFSQGRLMLCAVSA